MAEAVRTGLDPPHELISLADYRKRHALYRTDMGLQALSGANVSSSNVLSSPPLPKFHTGYLQILNLLFSHTYKAGAAMIAIWDDHEIANNPSVDGAQNHNDGEGSWIDRKVDRITNTLQITATHCNVMHHTAPHFNTVHQGAPQCTTPQQQHTARHCNTLQNTATHCKTLQHPATYCNTL